MKSNLINKLKLVKFKDIIGVFIFLFLIIPAFIYKMILKIRKKDLWLICEQENTARDNGYSFYKYICINHPEIKTIYAINKKTDAYKKVKGYGKVINWGSISHYFYYMSATRNISSHKNGNPNHTLFTILHLYLNLYNNRVFLQHGITKDDLEMFYYKNTKFKKFICGAKREYEYILEKFGYPKENVVYTGFSRFDSLYDIKPIKQILIIPTWRNWLGSDTNIFGEKIDFTTTDYYKYWNSLLNNKKFKEIIEKENIEVIFYPHMQMQKYINLFTTSSDNIKIVDINTKDIQELLKESALLITDYSSVYFDFAYMNKPVLYYQFDYNEYRTKQHHIGYFDYNTDGFGKVSDNEIELVESIRKIIKNNFKLDKEYQERINKFFELRDKNNSERIFKNIK